MKKGKYMLLIAALVVIVNLAIPISNPSHIHQPFGLAIAYSIIPALLYYVSRFHFLATWKESGTASLISCGLITVLLICAGHYIEADFSTLGTGFSILSSLICLCAGLHDMCAGEELEFA